MDSHHFPHLKWPYQASHARKMAGKAFKRLLPNEAPMHLGNAAAVHEKCELNGHLIGGDGYNNGYDHKSPILHGLMMAWWGWFLTGLWMIMGITTQSPKYTPCCFLAMEGVSKTSATNYMFNRLWKKLFSKRKAADWRFLTGAELYRHLTKVPRNEDRCHGQLWVALGANCLQINQDMTTGEEPTLQASGNLTMKIGTTSN